MTRRLVSVAAVFILLPVAVVTAPVWVGVAAAADIVGRYWRFPTVRLGAFAVVYLIHQWIGMVVAVGLWLAEAATRSSRIDAYRRVQTWWANSLLRWARRLLRVEIELDEVPPAPEGRFVLMSRHASMVDAVLPIILVTRDHDRYVHYVLKDELLWDPSIATFGLKLGNRFVARGTRTAADIEGIAQLARQAKPNSALVIFPEGTYANNKTRTRVLRSLTGKVNNGELEADVLEQARKLQHLLPPKPAGALTLLANRPDADVVVVGHVGLEGVAELKGLRSRLPLEHPVAIRWWSYQRRELPSTPDHLEGWLQQRWIEVDQWVTGHLVERDQGSV